MIYYYIILHNYNNGIIYQILGASAGEVREVPDNCLSLAVHFVCSDINCEIYSSL